MRISQPVGPQAARRETLYLAVFLLMVTMLLTACSAHAQVKYVVPLAPMTVQFFAHPDQIILPDKVQVMYTNGKTGMKHVTWDTSVLHDPIMRGVEVTGTVDGVTLPARALVLIDQTYVLDLPRLTIEEVEDANVAANMEHACAVEIAPETSIAWSPDKQVMAAAFDYAFALWHLGETYPDAVSSLSGAGIGGLHHPTWSYDGKYVAVHNGFGAYGTLYVLSYPDCRVCASLPVYKVICWAPDADELLIAFPSDIRPAFAAPVDSTADLMIYNVDTGKARMLLQADEYTIYWPTGWNDPDEVTYGANAGGKIETGLSLHLDR